MPLSTIFKGTFLFMVLEIITLALLVAFPQISLFLVERMWTN